MVPKRAAVVALFVLCSGPPGILAQGVPPFRLDQVERLLLGEVHGIMADLQRDCIAFDLGESNLLRLRAAGADDAFIEDLRSVCQRIPEPEVSSTSACAVRALLDVVQVRAERREYEQAFMTLWSLQGRVRALSVVYPGEATWRTYRQEIDALANSVRRACEAWRQIRLERGLTAPACTEVPEGG